MTIMMIVRDVAVEVVNVPDVAEVEIVREIVREEEGGVEVGIAPEEDEVGIIETTEEGTMVVEDDKVVVVTDTDVKFKYYNYLQHVSTKVLPNRSPALRKLLLILPPASDGK